MHNSAEPPTPPAQPRAAGGPTVVVMGVSGAGKSSLGRPLAEKMGAIFDDADDFHLPANRARLASGVPLTDAERQPWYGVLHARLREVQAAGRAHVLACSALHAGLRAWLRGDAPPLPLIFILLECPREELARRLLVRPGHFMPATLLDSQLQTLEITPDLVRIANDRPPAEVLADILAAVRAPTFNPS